MKCPKCDYEWETHSKLGMVTCPSCLLKVKNTNIVQQLEQSLNVTKLEKDTL